MPIDRSHRLRDQTVAMDGPADIDLVFAALERLGERGFFTKERAERDVAEEIGYQLVAHPEWVRPHVSRLVRGGLGLTFDWQCLLMKDAPDDLVEHLLERRGRDPDDWRTTWALMASRSEPAMAALATSARANEATRRNLQDLGFHLPADGPAEPRFSVQCQALRYLPGSDATAAPHAVGLPLDRVRAPGESDITFHYLSVSPALVPDMPAWEGQAHLVSIRDLTGWVHWAKLESDGRIRTARIEHDDDHSLDDLNDRLDDHAAQPQESGAVELLPFDDALTYSNQHVFSTPDVIGVIGGPPMGLAPAPECIECGRLMFHVGYTAHSVRRYGDGFRSLFICEDCRVSATVATMWN